MFILLWLVSVTKLSLVHINMLTFFCSLFYVQILCTCTGGYDERVVENKEYYMELRLLAQKLGIAECITFLRSFTDAEKLALLAACTTLLYTPSNEHFGICPLEAMYMNRPVIAVNNGGPLETVVDGKTGFLCEQTPEAFAEKMAHFVQVPGARDKMGQAGKQRVIGSFSFLAFTNKLDDIVRGMTKCNGQHNNVWRFASRKLLLLLLLLTGICAYLVFFHNFQSV